MRRVIVGLSLLAASCTPEVKSPSVNQPPLPVLGAPVTAAPGEPVFIDGSASTDPDGIISDVFLLTGDGSDPVVDFSTTHAFEKPGQYLIEHTVKDNAGASARAGEDQCRGAVGDPVITRPGARTLRSPPSPAQGADGARSAGARPR